MDEDSILGTGWNFPVSFDNLNHRTVMVSGIEDVKQSIYIILHTTPGERIMEPEFGCNLKQLVFENIDESLHSKLNHVVYHALLNYEPRVKFIGTEILEKVEAAGILHISIEFSLIITNTRHNLVFPFYFKEGTNI
ncbi:GPW/gp25 family protein [Pedobacter gandavensis]|uniref:IraD/Gp25-like domain-containing protein n=1 Tax=Pedobacter gandavensis TaxID=2679963 RepID=A0ABR6ESC5_9SPHI|nr:GPW/gp25 family protein [Pedobacter gandavensis]MBB2147957.1 hypothetical protein [Pedobacter gandavensis]